MVQDLIGVLIAFVIMPFVVVVMVFVIIAGFVVEAGTLLIDLKIWKFENLKMHP